MDNWRAAMVGWSRLNDLALQVYGYVRDRTQACEVLRLMNAANHLCYGDLSGQNMIDVLDQKLTQCPPPAHSIQCPVLTGRLPGTVCSSSGMRAPPLINRQRGGQAA